MSLGAYYDDTITEFLIATPDSVIGALAGASQFPMSLEQRDAWRAQIPILKAALADVNGSIFLEFKVPRIGSRIDAVVISGGTIFVIEFKVGDAEYSKSGMDQAWDYALDLKNFHEASHNAFICPILVSTSAPPASTHVAEPHADYVFAPLKCNAETLTSTIHEVQARWRAGSIDPKQWSSSPYKPTPTIIEAARALYSSHSVVDLARNDAGAKNLATTAATIEALIERARAEKSKIIAFVTGVPGAGKTLVGLNTATTRFDTTSATHAVFLSGNGPLVSVLTEALTRDEWARQKLTTAKARKGESKQKVKAFIQNVHHFRDAGLADNGPPSDHVVIFDEAQRAWDRAMTADFMKRKKGRPGFKQSEPELLIEYMDRHDWAVIVCLVGGGQEINRGEGGISEWLDALCNQFLDWQVYVSPHLSDSEFAAGDAIDRVRVRGNFHPDERLHLSVSMRSFRAESVSAFVKSVLDCETQVARESLAAISSRYPIAVTRDLDIAKAWIRAKARGSERYGLVATSGALRLKPHAVDVRVPIDPIHWFLNEADDVRSSYYLEDAATEFQVQGLELDWVCVNWDADLRYTDSSWNYHSFVGSKWSNVNLEARRRYLRNAYRVLLTRARQGMVIFIPPGDSKDPTRDPAYYDSTYRYLRSLGIQPLDSLESKVLINAA